MLHVYPEDATPKHEVEGTDCWCHPTSYCVCPHCDATGICPYCDDGYLPLTNVPDEDVALVVHNATGSGH
jgi:hypothetical protein